MQIHIIKEYFTQIRSRGDRKTPCEIIFEIIAQKDTFLRPFPPFLM